MKNLALSKLALFCLLLIVSISIFQFCKKDDDEPQVQGDPPTAAFTVNIASLVEGENAQFTDQSTNGPTSWQWDFGDGATSTLQNPSHTYSTKGKYTVSLVATNEHGSDTETKAEFIQVITEEEVGVSEAFVNIDDNDGTINNFDLNSGTLSISFTGEAPEIVNGTILTLDRDTMGYLRKVVSVQKADNNLTIETEPAFFTDVFVDKDFNLKTDLYEPKSQLKTTSSNAEISWALTDDDGYIHPLEIIYHHKNGEISKKSAIGFKAGKTSGNYDMININEDFANTDLYGAKDSAAHFFIEKGDFSFVSDAVFEFDFEYKGELTPDTKVRKGDLHKFKFYLDSELELDAKLALDLKKSQEKSDEHEMYKAPKVTVKFVVGTVPVWITFESKIVGKFEIKGDAALHADWGFKTTQVLKSGADYSKNSDTYEPIIEYTPTNTPLPLNLSGEFNFSSKFEIYPRVEMMFYDFYGPNCEISTFVEGSYKSKFQSEVTLKGAKNFLAWNSGLDVGVDMRLGSKLTFLWGLYDKEFGPKDYNCFKHSIWEAPHVIELLTENPPAEAITDSKVDLSFEVRDSWDNPLALCPVSFKGDGSVPEGILLTDTEGKIDVEWTMPSTAKSDCKLTATIYKSDKTEVDKEEVTLNCKLEEKVGSVTTADVALVTDSSAYCGGEVTFDGNIAIIAAGVCWSTDPNPTVDDFFTADATEEGQFTSKLEDLLFNTTYYVRAYVTNAKGTAYGEQKEFTTLNKIILPTVTTDDVTEITSTTATSGGEVKEDGTVDITSRGVCWSLNENPTIDDNKTTDGDGLGVFTSNLTNLEPATTYYVRAYATATDTTTYGQQIGFTTEEQAGLPTVTTADISGITINSAQGGGEVTDDGGDAVSAYGVCWSTSEEPTISDAKTNDGSGTGVFTSNLTNLSENTTYYVRAYATNTVGTAYGEQKQFISDIDDENTITDPRDNQKYKIVTIGTQTWFAENLNYNTTSGSLWYDNSSSNGSIYGRLYTWTVAKTACPDGWHLPSDEEWKTLEMFLGMSESEANKTGFRQTNGEGSKLKSTSGWNDGGNGSNSSGFNALPGGGSNSSGFNFLGDYGIWWASDELNSQEARRRGLYKSYPHIARDGDKKTYSFSVRCIKD